MADPNVDEIGKVNIADLEEPDSSGAELDDAQLDKVSGGGMYGDPGFDGN